MLKKNRIIAILFLFILSIGIVRNITDISPSSSHNHQSPRSQTVIFYWVGDLPQFTFNYANYSSVPTDVFNLTWSYFTNNTSGWGYVHNFTVYVNSPSNVVINTFVNYSPNGYWEIDEYGQLYNSVDTIFYTISDFPTSVNINLTKFDITLGSALHIYFYFDVWENGVIVSETASLNLNYQPTTTTNIIPPFNTDYMIIGIVLLGGVIVIYYYYQSKTKKKEETTRYEYEEE